VSDFDGFVGTAYMESCGASSCSVDDGEWQLDEIHEETDECEDVSDEAEGSDHGV